MHRPLLFVDASTALLLRDEPDTVSGPPPFATESLGDCVATTAPACISVRFSRPNATLTTILWQLSCGGGSRREIPHLGAMIYGSQTALALRIVTLFTRQAAFFSSSLFPR
jgi:hypothetical protein